MAYNGFNNNWVNNNGFNNNGFDSSEGWKHGKHHKKHGKHGKHHKKHHNKFFNPCPKPNICDCVNTTADPTGYFALFTQSVTLLQQQPTNPQRQAFFFAAPGQQLSPFQSQVLAVTNNINTGGLNLPPSPQSQALIQNMLQLLAIIGAAGVNGVVIPAINFAPIVQTIQYALCVAQFPFKQRLKVLPDLNARLVAAIAAVQQVPLTPTTIQVITNILNLLGQIVNTPDRCLPQNNVW